MDIINLIKESDSRAWAIAFSALIAFWGYVSSLRPYIYIYLSANPLVKIETLFNIANKGRVGAKNVQIYLEQGDTIHRFTEQTARDGKPLVSDQGRDLNLQIPVFHKSEVIPPDFHYETMLGRGAGFSGNEKFTESFVLVAKYQSSIPVISWIPYVGRFKEKFLLNPRMFNDLVGSDSKELIEVNLNITNNARITGTAVRKYP